MARPGSMVLLAGVLAVLVAPLLMGAVGWSEGASLLRVDPLLSLCLAQQPGAAPIAWYGISLAPQTALPLVLAALLYARGIRVATRAGSAPDAWRAVCFAAGLAVLAVALVSPLCRLAALSAAAHMVQHVLVVAVAPPLLLLGRPLDLIGRAWGASRAGRVAAGLAAPGRATLLYAMAIWGSHAPVVYEAALRDPTLHVALLLAQLAAGLLFWTVILRATGSGRAEGAAIGGGVMAAFVTFMHTGLLGAILTFAPRPWYPIFGDLPLPGGLTPLADQQLAGLIMWVPMGLVFLVAALAVLGRLLRLDEPARRPA